MSLNEIYPKTWSINMCVTHRLLLAEHFGHTSLSLLPFCSFFFSSLLFLLFFSFPFCPSSLLYSFFSLFSSFPFSPFWFTHKPNSKILLATKLFVNLFDLIKPTRIYLCCLKIMMQTINAWIRYLGFNVILDTCYDMQLSIK